MGITDRITGRFKKAAGDLADDDTLKREGAVEERKADAKDELARAEANAEQERQRAEEQARKVDRLDSAT